MAEAPAVRVVHIGNRPPVVDPPQQPFRWRNCDSPVPRFDTRKTASDWRIERTGSG